MEGIASLFFRRKNDLSTHPRRDLSPNVRYFHPQLAKTKTPHISPQLIQHIAGRSEGLEKLLCAGTELRSILGDQEGWNLTMCRLLRTYSGVAGPGE